MAEEKDKQNSKPEKSLLDRVIESDSAFEWEEVQLPSQGRYYGNSPWSSISIPDGKVRVRPMGIDVEKILATHRLTKSGRALGLMFERCVEFPEGFKADSLIVGDQTFLLYYIRGITHGNIYEFGVTCTNEACGEHSIHEYNLNLLADTMTHPNDNLGDEPFPVKLPYLSERYEEDFIVKVRLFRAGDIRSMTSNKSIKKKLKRGGASQELADDTIEKNLSMAIVEAAGDSSRIKIDKLVKKLHSKDAAAIRSFLDNHTPGIDTSIEVECPACGNVMEMELPITASFFRPSEA